MNGNGPGLSDKRRRRDSFLRMLIIVFSFVPLLVLTFMVLTLADRSMGTRISIEGRPVRQWTLLRSVLDRDEIGMELENCGSEAIRSFHFGLTPKFVFSGPSASPEDTGLLAVLAGSFWILILGLMISFPTALLTALWIDSSITVSKSARIASAVINQFMRVPHVLYGIFALALFGRLEHSFPGFGVRSVGSAALLMALVALPKLTVMMVREIDLVLEEIRTAAYALGASWSTVVFRQILPASIEAVFAETVRISAGLLGLASPFIVLGASQYVSAAPRGLGDRFIILPAQVFQWSLRPDEIHRNLAASSALVLLLCILLLNIISYTWRRRISRRREGLR